MTQRIAIVDFGAGNLRSVARSFERMARETTGAQIDVTADSRVVRSADRIVLPGVGTFADCKAGLAKLPDMIDTLNARVLDDCVPFFGICVGMQLMAQRGLEYGGATGLGWLQGSVERLTPNTPTCKVPHMGWNNFTHLADHPILAGMTLETHTFFVHSYAMTTPHALATTDHGQEITAVAGRDNIIGTQFHPEKSQAAGLRIIANFLEWTP